MRGCRAETGGEAEEWMTAGALGGCPEVDAPSEGRTKPIDGRLTLTMPSGRSGAEGGSSDLRIVAVS